MARFLKDSDYNFQVKKEILKLLDGSTPELDQNLKLLQAERAAIKQMRNRLSGRFDCDAIFTPSTTEPDTRDEFIIMIAVDITLYHLYSQTGSKDVPSHRETRYQDAIDWLRDASKPDGIATDLPTSISDENPGDVRIWSKPQENHDW